MKQIGYVVLFLLLSAVWGTAYVATKIGLQTVPPTLLAALRFDVGALLLFGYIALRRLAWRPSARDGYSLVVGGTFLVGVHHVLLFAGQQHVTSAVAAVLLGLIPVLTPALARLTSTGERLTPAAVAGIAVGFVGVAVIADPDPTNLLEDVYGVVLVFASAVAWAVGAVLTYGRAQTLSLPAQGAWMMLVGSVFLHLVSYALGEPVPTVWSRESVAVVGYLAVVSGVAGFLIYFVLLDALGPTEVSLLEYVTPLFAALVGWFALGELLSTRTVVGFGLIVAGFVLVKREALRIELRRWKARRERPRDGG